MKSALLFCASSVLAACAASKPAPESPPPVVASAPAPAPQPVEDAGETQEERAKRLAAELDNMEMSAVGVYAGNTGSAADQADWFVRAANGDDDARVKELSLPECWDDECGGFAQQAGKKFQAKLTGKAREVGARAVVEADIFCPGKKQRCDFVYVLFERRDGKWLVADIIEDDAKADAWLRP